MQAPVALTFCAVAFWKKGWSSAPIPQTRTVRSRVERGAGAEADMSYSLLSKDSLYDTRGYNFIILAGAVWESLGNSLKASDVPPLQPTPAFQEDLTRSQVLV